MRVSKCDYDVNEKGCGFFPLKMKAGLFFRSFLKNSNKSGTGEFFLRIEDIAQSVFGNGIAYCLSVLANRW